MSCLPGVCLFFFLPILQPLCVGGHRDVSKPGQPTPEILPLLSQAQSSQAEVLGHGLADPEGEVSVVGIFEQLIQRSWEPCLASDTARTEPKLCPKLKPV